LVNLSKITFQTKTEVEVFFLKPDHMFEVTGAIITLLLSNEKIVKER